MALAAVPTALIVGVGTMFTGGPAVTGAVSSTLAQAAVDSNTAADDHAEHEEIIDSEQALSVSPALYAPQESDTPQLAAKRTELKTLTERLPEVQLAYRQAKKAADEAAESTAADAAIEVVTDLASVEDDVMAAPALAKAERTRSRIENRVKALTKELESVTDKDELKLAGASIATRNLAEPKVVKFPVPVDGLRDNDNWGNTSGLWSSYHTGNDFSASCGTPVYAATRGQVSIVTDQSWAGPQLVQVSMGTGKLSTWYAHMQSVSVNDGQAVKAGQQIGTVGSEGNSTGCHLHFELHPLGGSIYEDSTDPVPWLKATGAYPGFKRNMAALAKLGVSTPPRQMPASAGSGSSGASDQPSTSATPSQTPRPTPTTQPKPKPKPKPSTSTPPPTSTSPTMPPSPPSTTAPPPSSSTAPTPPPSGSTSPTP